MLNRTLLLFGALACIGATAALAREGMQAAERKPAALVAAKPLPVPTDEIWKTGAWPFQAAKATLSCRPLGADRRPAVFVDINGESYGLNALAASIAVTPRPILIQGVDTRAMIERGATLCATDAKPLDLHRG